MKTQSRNTLRFQNSTVLLLNSEDSVGPGAACLEHSAVRLRPRLTLHQPLSGFWLHFLVRPGLTTVAVAGLELTESHVPLPSG